jgi:hypothetical protein
MTFATIVLAVFLFQGEGGSAAPHEKPAGPPHWYEQVTGVLAIPAAMIGCAYSYLLINKTRLESKKLELEIHEKSVAAATEPPASAAALAPGHPAEAITETLVNRRYSVLILRYIVLELSLSIYSGCTAPLNWLTAAAIGGFYVVTGGSSSSPRVMIALAGTQSLAATLVNIGYWVLFLLLGWPLFKDINHVLGIQLSEYSPRALIRNLRKSR